MGASDLTTERAGAGNEEIADGDRLAANGANGHAAAPASDDESVRVQPPASNGAVVVADDPAVEEGPVDELETPLIDGTPERGGRRARRRGVKRARADGEQPGGAAAGRVEAGDEEPPLRGRAARRAKAAQPATPAARRAELVATAATIAAAAAEAEAAPPATTSKRAGRIVRRVAAFTAILLLPASAYALVATDGPLTSLSRADATYLSAELVAADQGVRNQLVRLRPRHTSRALARTRDATLTARSLAIEVGKQGGAEARLLQRAAKLEAAWLDAVGSVLSNPRSPLRDELVPRDGALRAALAELPGPEARRKGGTKRLVRYARSRAAGAG